MPEEQHFECPNCSAPGIAKTAVNPTCIYCGVTVPEVEFPGGKFPWETEEPSPTFEGEFPVIFFTSNSDFLQFTAGLLPKGYTIYWISPDSLDQFTLQQCLQEDKASIPKDLSIQYGGYLVIMTSSNQENLLRALRRGFSHGCCVPLFEKCGWRYSKEELRQYLPKDQLVSLKEIPKIWALFRDLAILGYCLVYLALIVFWLIPRNEIAGSLETLFFIVVLCLTFWLHWKVFIFACSHALGKTILNIVPDRVSKFYGVTFDFD